MQHTVVEVASDEVVRMDRHRGVAGGCGDARDVSGDRASAGEPRERQILGWTARGLPVRCATS